MEPRRSTCPTRYYVRICDYYNLHTVAILHVQKSRMCIIAHCTLEQLTTMKLLDSATNQTEWEGVHLPVWLMHQVRVTEPTYIYLKNTIDNFSPIYEFVLNLGKIELSLRFDLEHQGDFRTSWMSCRCPIDEQPTYGTLVQLRKVAKASFPNQGADRY